MPQTRPGNNNHYTNKKSPEERFQSLPDCCKNLVWLYLIGFKTESRPGFNTELYKGTVADRADNPGTRRHATRYREIFGELPVEFNTDSKFRKRAQTAYTMPHQLIVQKVVPNYPSFDPPAATTEAASTTIASPSTNNQSASGSSCQDKDFH